MFHMQVCTTRICICLYTCLCAWDGSFWTPPHGNWWYEYYPLMAGVYQHKDANVKQLVITFHCKGNHSETHKHFSTPRRIPPNSGHLNYKIHKGVPFRTAYTTVQTNHHSREQSQIVVLNSKRPRSATYEELHWWIPLLLDCYPDFKDVLIAYKPSSSSSDSSFSLLAGTPYRGVGKREPGLYGYDPKPTR